MKKVCILIIILCLFVGCEPSYRLYVKNSTDRNVDLDLLQIKFYEQFVLDTTYTLYANFEQDVIHNIKWNTVKRLTQKKKIERMNDSTFHIGLCKRSTYLISSGMLIPFEKIIVNQEYHNDTLIIYGKNRNVRKNMGHIKVHNRGFFCTAKVIELL